MDTISTIAAPAVHHSPLQSLPSDIIGALQDCLHAKQIGYVLGCACKAFQPTEKTWERYAQLCSSLTRHAVVTCKWSEWCKELRLLRPSDMNGHSHAAHTIPITYQFEDGASKISPTPRFVLQIWSGRKILTTTRLSFEQDVAIGTASNWAPPGSEYSSSMAAGTLHLHQDDGQSCRHCQQLRAGGTSADSIGVRLGFDAKPLQLTVIALPSSTATPEIAPTVVFSVSMRSRFSRDSHREFLDACKGTGAPVTGNDERRRPRHSATWGLVNHQPDLVFYPSEYGMYLPSHGGMPRPACVVRILRDAAGAATELMIEEFNWEFPAPEIGGFRLNRVGVKRHVQGYDAE